MNKNQNKKNATYALARIFAAAAVLILSASSLWANAFRLPNQDPEAIARGDAFTATADDPSAIYYNPAGITQLPGMQVSAGAYIISADTHFTSSTAGAGGAKTATTPQLVPQLYATYTLTNLPLSFGLGVYAPYGLAINYGQDAPFHTAGIGGALVYATVNPVAAWKISKTFSVAIGPTLNFSQVTLNQGITPIPPGDFFKFKGNGWAAGYNAGLLFQPTPAWSFGINYRSTTRVKYDGTASQNTGVFSPSTSSSTTIPFPEFITGGISFRPTSNWNFEFDLDYTKWSEVKTVTINNTPFGNAPLTLNYQNSFIYEFGATRQLGNGYYASVGYMYSEDSSPSSTFNPLIPDANLSLGGIGIGHRGKRWDWAAAFQFAYGGRTISDNANPSVDGKYTTFNKALNISGTYKF